ncbi:MAG: hypothetical protein ACLQVM_03610 [Terriglobia bacterium]
MKKKTVQFNARKTVKVPVEVDFVTRSGKRVDFEARKPVKKRVRVKFQARKSGR